MEKGKQKVTSVLGEKNVVIDNDLNKNLAMKVAKELSEQYTKGFAGFQPLKDKNGKNAPISAYFELVLKYPELVGNGVDPTFYNLAKEAIEYKKQGATERQINERYAKSVLRR